MFVQMIQFVNISCDIMLCFDVLGLMFEVDVEVFIVFDELFDDFEGECIGLIIFNSLFVQIFLLIDDYDFIWEYLESMIWSFDFIDCVFEYWVGMLNGDGVFLIGDGFVLCVMGFDYFDDDWLWLVVFVMDNEVNGVLIVIFEEVVVYVVFWNVCVFVLNLVQGKDVVVSVEFVRVVDVIGGVVFGLWDMMIVLDIVFQVYEQEVIELCGEVQVVWMDILNLWIVLLLVCFLGFVVVLWRVCL